MAQAAVYYMFTTQVRILSCRMFMNSIRDSNHKLVADTISRMELDDYFEITHNEIRCIKTGSTMIFKGLANNLSSLKSIENVGICIVDEAESITEEAWNFLTPTIRAIGSEIWVSFNPRLQSDATWKKFIENPPPDSAVVKIGIEDNPFASEALLAELEHDKNTDIERYKWIWLGEPMGSDTMTFITSVMINEAQKRVAVRNEKLKITAGLDVSEMGKDWTVLIRRRGNEILSIHKLHKGTNPMVAEWVKSIFVENPWDTIVIDATGSSGVADLIDEWAEANKLFEVIKWKASRSPRNKTKYLNARAESWGIMRSWISTCGQLTKDAEWTELSTVNYKFATKEQIQLQAKSTLKKSPDYGDALALSLWIRDEEKIKPQDNYNYMNYYGGQIT